MKKWKWKIGCENELNFIAIWATKLLSILFKSRPICLKKGSENLLIQLNSLFLYDLPDKPDFPTGIRQPQGKDFN